jgi:hypothetical protein
MTRHSLKQAISGRGCILLLLPLLVIVHGCDTASDVDATPEAAAPEATALEAAAPEAAAGQQLQNSAAQRSTQNARVRRKPRNAPRLLSAFFGLDNQILAGIPGCRNAGNDDGLPVVFSRTLNPFSIQETDFAVISASGARSTPVCATLLPAINPGELRTVLLIGEFGSPDDQPEAVTIVSTLFSDRAEGRRVNFEGATKRVVPLEDGPSLALAESVPRIQRALTRNGCPSEGTAQVVRAVWDGGITKPGGAEVDDVERELYRVTIEGARGQISEVTPFAFGDLNDGDNNHLLCLDVEGLPIEVSFPAGAMTDPNDDLNPRTNVPVTGNLEDGNDDDDYEVDDDE